MTQRTQDAIASAVSRVAAGIEVSDLSGQLRVAANREDDLKTL